MSDLVLLLHLLNALSSARLLDEIMVFAYLSVPVFVILVAVLGPTEYARRALEVLRALCRVRLSE